MPGKFEGEPDYLEYIWDKWVMMGDGESHFDDNDREYTYFEVDAIDIDEMENAGIWDTDVLEDLPIVIIWEDDNGFVYHKLFATRESALDFLDEMLV